MFSRLEIAIRSSSRRICSTRLPLPPPPPPPSLPLVDAEEEEEAPPSVEAVAAVVVVVVVVVVVLAAGAVFHATAATAILGKARKKTWSGRKRATAPYRSPPRAPISWAIMRRPLLVEGARIGGASQIRF